MLGRLVDAVRLPRQIDQDWGEGRVDVELTFGNSGPTATDHLIVFQTLNWLFAPG